MADKTDQGTKRMHVIRREAIAACLQEVMAAGLPVHEDILFFADTTYGLGLNDLASALTNGDFEDREVILKLIFFPDHRTRMQIEKHIGNTIFSPVDEKGVIARLVQQQKSVQLHAAGSAVCFPVIATRELLSNMVEKLYLCRVLDQRICAVLDRCLCPSHARSARVLLRCRGDRFSGSSQRFLCSLIEKASDGNHDFDQLFGMSLVLLAERPAQMSVEAYFIDRKRALIDTLKNIREFEKRRDQYGMEYLLMQRFQVPHESEEDVLKRLYLLSTITDELFRLSPSSVQSMRHRNLGRFNAGREKDLEQLFRRLS